MLYHLLVFRGDIPVSISAVKNDRYFSHAVSNAIYKALVGSLYTIKIYDNGIVVDGTNIPERFLGSTIPFVYQNRTVELRVLPYTLS